MANIILLNEQTRSVNKLFLYAIIFSSALTIYADGENYNGQVYRESISVKVP